MGVSVRGTVHPYLHHPCPIVWVRDTIQAMANRVPMRARVHEGAQSQRGSDGVHRLPTADPAVATSPARRPPAMPCAIMTIIPGPGTAFRMTQARANPRTMCASTPLMQSRTSTF
jgi:hypothetical protein